MSFFVYAKLPLSPGLAGRLPLVHETIERVLQADALGSLLGWGGSQATPGEAVTHHRLDMEVDDQARGLVVLKDALAELAAPDGTELHYTQDGQALQTVFAGAAWGASSPSTATSRSGLRMRR